MLQKEEMQLLGFSSLSAPTFHVILENEEHKVKQHRGAVQSHMEERFNFDISENISGKGSPKGRKVRGN